MIFLLHFSATSEQKSKDEILKAEEELLKNTIETRGKTLRKKKRRNFDDQHFRSFSSDGCR